MNQLVTLELARLHKGLAALGADVHPRAVRVQVLPHGTVVTKHLRAASVRTGDGSIVVVAAGATTGGGDQRVLKGGCRRRRLLQRSRVTGWNKTNG